MKFLDEIFTYKNNTQVIGLTDELNSFYVLNKFLSSNNNALVVASSIYHANMFYDKISKETDKVILFPMDDFITSVAVAMSPELKLKRLETLKRIQNKENGFRCIF